MRILILLLPVCCYRILSGTAAADEYRRLEEIGEADGKYLLQYAKMLQGDTFSHYSDATQDMSEEMRYIYPSGVQSWNVSNEAVPVLIPVIKGGLRV